MEPPLRRTAFKAPAPMRPKLFKTTSVAVNSKARAPGDDAVLPSLPSLEAMRRGQSAPSMSVKKIPDAMEKTGRPVEIMELYAQYCGKHAGLLKPSTLLKGLKRRGLDPTNAHVVVKCLQPTNGTNRISFPAFRDAFGVGVIPASPANAQEANAAVRMLVQSLGDVEVHRDANGSAYVLTTELLHHLRTARDIPEATAKAIMTHVDVGGTGQVSLLRCARCAMSDLFPVSVTKIYECGRLTRAFSELAPHSTLINKETLVRTYKSLGLKTVDSSLAISIVMLEGNRTGAGEADAIDFDTFARAARCGVLPMLLRPEKRSAVVKILLGTWRRAFMSLCAKGQRTISPETLCLAARKWGLTASQAAALVRITDVDESNSIDLVEFCSLMMAGVVERPEKGGVFARVGYVVGEIAPPNQGTDGREQDGQVVGGGDGKVGAAALDDALSSVAGSDSEGLRKRSISAPVDPANPAPLRSAVVASGSHLRQLSLASSASGDWDAHRVPLNEDDDDDDEEAGKSQAVSDAVVPGCECWNGEPLHIWLLQRSGWLGSWQHKYAVVEPGKLLSYDEENPGDARWSPTTVIDLGDSGQVEQQVEVLQVRGTNASATLKCFSKEDADRVLAVLVHGNVM